MMESCCEGLPFASDIATVNVDVAGVEPLGVPLITPVETLKDAQAGKVPAEMLNVGAEHPDVATFCEYATPFRAAGNETFVIVHDADGGVNVSSAKPLLFSAEKMFPPALIAPPAL